MFNRGVPAFYNPRLDNSSKEEHFLLKRRCRLMDQLKDLDPTKVFYAHSKRVLERKLRETEKKLGIKP